MPSPGASLWAWLNGLSVLLSLAVWLVALGLVLRARRSVADEPESGP